MHFSAQYHCQYHATTAFSVHEPSLISAPRIWTASHSLLLDVTSRLTAFSLLLPLL